MPLDAAVPLLRRTATIGARRLLAKEPAMTLETLNTLFSGATFLVIAGTAIAAMGQLRHLRASNQLSALVTVLEDWQKPEMQAWIRFVREELPERLKDPAYLDSIESMRSDRTVHPWLHMCDYFEQLGAWIKYGYVDKTAYLDVGSANVQHFYQSVRPGIERLRAVRQSNAIYENFEYLAVISRQWNLAHPNGAYPRGVPRFAEIDR